MDLVVRELSADEHAKWDAFVLAQQTGSFFQTSLWLDQRPEGELHILVCDDNGQWVGGYAYLLNRRLGLRRIVRPKLTSYHAPVLADRVLSDEYANLMDTVLMRILHYLPRYDSISLTFPPAYMRRPDFLDTGFAYSAWKTNRIYPPMSEEDLLARYSGQTRKNLHSTMKSSMRVATDIDPDLVHRLSEMSLANAGRAHPFTRTELARLLSRLDTRSNLMTMGVTTDDNVTFAAALMVYDARAIYGLLFGIDRKHGGSGCGLLLMHQCIVWAMERNLIFDFNGSTIHGINAFFQKFKPTSSPVHHYSYGRSSRVRLVNAFATRLGHPLY